MVHIPRQVEYALMALAVMQGGQPGQLFPVRALSEQLGTPYDVLSKVMQAMAREGILRSVQGKYGGYQIARDLRDISIEELSAKVVGPTAVAACLQPGHTCSHRKGCLIHTAVKRLDDRIRGVLSDVSVHDLIA